MRLKPVLAATAAITAIGSTELPRGPAPQAPIMRLTLPDAQKTAPGKSSLLPAEVKPRPSGVPTPLGTLVPQRAALPPSPLAAAVQPREGAPAQQTAKSLLHPTKVIAEKTVTPSDGKPPRVAEYHWFEAEPREGIAAIGYGHPRRQRGSEFLIGFKCKIGSGKVTFVMFEAGSSRSQFNKGQKVAVTLDIDSTKAPLDGVISGNEGTVFPRASAALSADDKLFKAMDEDKVLRIDIDGWSAAAPLFLIKDVMPVFNKACAKRKTKVTGPVQAGSPVAGKAAPG